MLLQTPQLVLVPDNQGHLFLHATTFFDKINFQAKGHKVARKLKKDGTLKVELYVVSNNSFSEEVLKMQCINPVVHRVDLGNILEVDEEGHLSGTVEATIYFLNPNKNARSDRRRGGRTVVRSTSGGRPSRPNPEKQ
ncbi:MAG: hypothetical protein AAF960_16835 [Bacteroidota bacterium]